MAFPIRKCVPFLFFLILFHCIRAFPIPIHMHPSFPTIPHRPHISITETRTHIHALLEHPALNESTAARVTLSTNPLTVHISPLTGRPLSRRIPLQKTFSDVVIRADSGAIELLLLKTVADLPGAIDACKGAKRAGCLHKLARRVCLPGHLRLALATLPCGKGCNQFVLEDCQKTDVLAEGAAVLTQMVFGCVAGMMVLSYGWGFASALLSIPRELGTLVIWAYDSFARVRLEGVKIGLMDAMSRVV